MPIYFNNIIPFVDWLKQIDWGKQMNLIETLIVIGIGYCVGMALATLLIILYEKLR